MAKSAGLQTLERYQNEAYDRRNTKLRKTHNTNILTHTQFVLIGHKFQCKTPMKHVIIVSHRSSILCREGFTAAGPGGPPPGKCSEMRFQANPDGTILPQNELLSCEPRGSLTACWTILRSEIKVNSVHRVLRANFVAIVHKFVENKKLVVDSRGGSRLPIPSGSAPAMHPRKRACKIPSRYFLKHCFIQ
jgi:hypothetical protein